MPFSWDKLQMAVKARNAICSQDSAPLGRGVNLSPSSNPRIYAGSQGTSLGPRISGVALC